MLEKRCAAARCHPGGDRGAGENLGCRRDGSRPAKPGCAFNSTSKCMCRKETVPAISASNTTHPVAADRPPVRTGAHDRLPTANSPESAHWDLGAIAPLPGTPPCESDPRPADALITGIFDPHVWSSAEAPGQPQAGRGSMKGPPGSPRGAVSLSRGLARGACQEVLTSGERVPTVPASTHPPGMCGGPPRRRGRPAVGVHLPAVRGPCSPRAQHCATACRFALMGAQ